MGNPLESSALPDSVARQCTVHCADERDGPATSRSRQLAASFCGKHAVHRYVSDAGYIHFDQNKVPTGCYADFADGNVAPDYDVQRVYVPDRKHAAPLAAVLQCGTRQMVLYHRKIHHD